MLNETLHHLTLDEIVQCYENQTTINGLIILADPNEQYFKVQIGYNENRTPIIGILPFSEFSVQNFSLIQPSYYYENAYSAGKNAVFMVGKTITARITSITNHNTIYLSRKSTQTKQFNNLKEGQEVTCTINSISHPNLFVDIGNGIEALNNVHELSFCRYNNVKNWFKVGEKFPALITHISEDKKIYVSRKQYFQKYASIFDDIREEQVRIVKIGSPADNGWFVEISPLTFALMDVKDPIQFKEGESVIAFVQKITKRPDNKLAYHLKFVSKC